MIYLPFKEFRFINTSKKCCVGFIDLVNSTADALSIIDEIKLEAYYSLFINNTTKIIKKYDGEVVKNIGDCLLFYFPKTDYKRNINELNKVLECFIEILQRRNRLNDDLIEENLPPFNYRITIDYGPLYFALTGVVNQIDIFGSIINICSKLKSLSMPNTVNIGENLYLRLSSFPIFAHIYKFSYSGEYTITDKNNYELYTVTKTKEKSNLKNNRLYCFSVGHRFDAKNTLDHKPKPKKQKEQIGFSLHNSNKKTNPARIIIIDDDKDIALTFKAMIQKLNDQYQITTFSDSLPGLKYLKENINSFNNNSHENHENLLVILDIRMNNINGIQLYKQIKCLDSSVKILFVTGIDIIDEMKSMIPGLTNDQIKKKPIDEKTLQNTVNKLLN